MSLPKAASSKSLYRPFTGALWPLEAAQIVAQIDSVNKVNETTNSLV